jgi:hypothetical protein
MNTQDMAEEMAHRERNENERLNRPLGPADPDRVKAILDAAPDMRDEPGKPYIAPEMQHRYLVLFTTPVEGGWKTVYQDAFAVVRDADGTMPFGYRPDDIGGLPVGEIKYVLSLEAAVRPNLLLVSGEYDKEIQLPGDGSAIMICDETMTDESDEEDDDEIAAIRADADRVFAKAPPRYKLDDANGFIDMPSSDD